MTSDVLLYKIEKKIFLDRGPTRYGLINRAYYPKNRYFLIFWLYHVILHILKPRKKHPEGTQLVKKNYPLWSFHRNSKFSLKVMTRQLIQFLKFFFMSQLIPICLKIWVQIKHHRIIFDRFWVFTRSMRMSDELLEK